MDFKLLLNKKVLLTTIKNSCYTGILNGVRRDKVHLTFLVVCNKDGSYKGVSGNRDNNKRWFNIQAIKEVKEI